MRRKRPFTSRLLTGLLLVAALCRCAAPTPSRLFRESLRSRALGQEREVCIYLPENFNSTRTYPVVYATDGQLLLTGNYRALLDSLIGERVIPALVLVGACSDETTVGNGLELRYYEYVAGADRSDRDPGNVPADPRIAGRFGKHLQFFTGELRDTLYARHGIRPDADHTLFFGCSNGGDYGMTLYGSLPAGSFTHYLCISPVGTDAEAFEPHTDATLYVAYGDREAEMPVMGDNLRALHRRLEAIDDPSIIVHVFDGGHDRRCWEEEFAAALITLFNRQDGRP